LRRLKKQRLVLRDQIAQLEAMLEPPNPPERMSDPAAAPSADLVSAVREALSVEGPLAHADDGFMPREPQDRLAQAVAEAIERREALVAEAGTGVGKTYAYLLPVLLSGRRTWSARPPRACRTSCSSAICRGCATS
jgi:ATP-dependent helicase YprA (DUF1998 family)